VRAAGGVASVALAVFLGAVRSGFCPSGEVAKALTAGASLLLAGEGVGLDGGADERGWWAGGPRHGMAAREADFARGRPAVGRTGEASAVEIGASIQRQGSGATLKAEV
jgi:hypothetical protein